MSPGSKQTQVQLQKLSPQQILQANIMQLTNVLLEQRIIKELEENPTLEIVDPESEENEDESSEDEAKEESDDSDFDWDELDSDSDRFELNKSSSESTDFLFTNHSPSSW